MTSLTMDAIYQIALHADYTEFMTILNSHPELYQYPMWHDKFHHDFPNQSYFKNWTWKENYLAKIEPNVMLFFNIAVEHNNVQPYLYGYDKMIMEMMDNYGDILYDQCDIISRYSVIPFVLNMDYPYLVIADNVIIGQASNYENAYDMAEKDNRYYYYIIVYLETMTPYFLKHGKSNVTRKLKIKRVRM